MSDINYPGQRQLNSATDSVAVGGVVSTSSPSVGATGAAVPASADYVGVNVGGTLTGLTGSGSGVYVEVNAALPAGANAIGSVAQDGQWDITDITGTISLPTGAATEAKQPALGVAGTPSADVITVQGASGMTALEVTGTVGVTQAGPFDILDILGTISLPTGAATEAKQPALGTAGAPSADVITVQGAVGMSPLDVAGTVAATQSGAWDIANITGTVSLPFGAATEAKQPALGIAGTPALDVITVQGTSGMTPFVVDGSGVTQPISGTVTVEQPTAANLNATVVGTVTVEQPTAANLNATVTGTVAATQSGTWDINNISGTVSLPAGAATAAKQPALGTAGSASSDVITVQGIASMTALKVDGSGVTQPVSYSGRSKVLLYRNDYSSVNVTTGSYVQVTASTASAINLLYIADTSGSAMILAVGGAGSEADQLYIGPGGNEAPYELNIPAGSRISIKALDVSATSGQMILTALS